jgi:CheY-like chemotaxis protein
MTTSRLNILVVLQRPEEARALQEDLESLGHRVQLSCELADSLRCLRKWQPDLVVAEEGLGREQPDAGLRLAEYCRATEDQVNGWPETRTLILIPVADWERFKRAQQTGAHVIVKGSNFGSAIRYIQTIADNIVTDRILGPALAGIHAFKGDAHSKCEDCEWIGAIISYGSSQVEVQQLTPVRIAVLSVLLFRRRHQSSAVIVDACRESPFVRRVLRGHTLKESAVKMEMTRLRRNLGEALEVIGAPRNPEYFLPFVSHGVKTYCLAGNRRLVHIRKDGGS